MSNTAIFQVPIGQATVVVVYGLVPSDQVNVEYLAGDKGDCDYTVDQLWVPFCPAGCQMTLDSLHNPKVFDTPGTYRLSFAGADNPDARFFVTEYVRSLIQ
jgi:hypothetical protein